MRMQELDRILDRHDVPLFLLLIRLIIGGERGGFARAGRTGDTDQAARQQGQLLHGVG